MVKEKVEKRELKLDKKWGKLFEPRTVERG